MSFKSLFSPISNLSSNSFDDNFTISPLSGSTQIPFALLSQALSTQNINSMVSSITSNIAMNSFSPVLNILGNFNPISSFTGTFEDISSSSGNFKSLVNIPFKVVPNMSGGAFCLSKVVIRRFFLYRIYYC